ncbi:hypothetical protein [Desulfosporosinus sp. BICA1-9]|uniref:hypothetical protein n=1 Tax=Desulfosporosinus sp. BICA1-9 TaxID=1531958 RepID=UPI00054C80DF|nr:hypothetical protein [Desulfosporosinus sp. BICA1-9]KJS50558.1 MAG: hypothetical protein VR66_02020 [Peptococcaceae bacterium BRH_c23]KJS82824.1 MAG: hypothetical protein JL57_23665 [Desulfosporosinus sp. BICA1-9]
MSTVQIKEICYKNYGKCVEISNGKVDLVVTVEAGPRIIRYGFTGDKNVFCDDSKLELEIDGEKWRLMGGHRLWSSPEAFPRTYYPDNSAVDWCKVENGIRLKSKVQPWVQIEKEIEIVLSPEESKVKILHRITNRNAWDVELAAWAASVMAPGGKEILPFATKKSHFSDGAKGARFMTIWAYTKMADPRVNWGNRYVTLQQDRNNKEDFKLGISNEDGWAAYLNERNLFIKRYKHFNDAIYPDNGVSYETYTIDYMLEMESLSPLKLLKPGATVEHTEEWELYNDVELTLNNENEIDALVARYII